jgi:hypothetical protein
MTNFYSLRRQQNLTEYENLQVEQYSKSYIVVACHWSFSHLVIRAIGIEKRGKKAN